MKSPRSLCRPAALLCTGLLLLTAACSTPSGNAEEGQRWYAMNNCSACHGNQGNDGKAPEIYPLDMSYRHFLSIVRDAGSPIMPPFPRQKLSDQDVADIYAWLKSK
jgi:mono/diheme cytochrome c family protein